MKIQSAISVLIKEGLKIKYHGGHNKITDNDGNILGLLICTTRGQAIVYVGDSKLPELEDACKKLRIPVGVKP